MNDYIATAISIVPEYTADTLQGLESRLDSIDSIKDYYSNNLAPVPKIKYEIVKDSAMSEEVFKGIYQNLEKKSIEILQTFIMKNSPSDIGLPDTLRQLIATNLESSAHPENFIPAMEYVRKSLRNGVFIRFLKHNDPYYSAPVNVPKYSIYQVISNETPAPYSYNDFYEFLKVQVSFSLI
jgi:Regulator of G protein signaling domain